ncbi:SIMPL domain-containing protein [Alteromonas sp. KUL49]|uniref:SIMPL domain-containing protein n=1 Tax=Alteromonas sp. KUL49 TaxID=2480798 RepID=UPI00102F15C9|nr:SIMPL domain-containing protein [Alteromonas sp. KUL49]TAP40906.1 DUF541 domain-containing protein [Alteromonas sp. KUL49]GEA11084.1 SIMPL domain-containing protein [Alteromonas sp. KUL49]
MKKFSLIGLILCVFVSANAFGADPDRTINVSGSGAVSLVPTGYKVTLVLEGKGNEIAEINSKLEQQRASVVGFLLESGVVERHIQSMQLSVQPNYEHSPQGRQQKGFIVRREIQLTHNHINHYDAIIDGALKRGVNSISGFSLIVMDDNQAYTRALKLALSNARSKAELVAQEFNVDLGEVVAISETSGNMPVPIMRSETFAREMPVSLPGERSVSAHVNVSFAINQ